MSRSSLVRRQTLLQRKEGQRGQVIVLFALFLVVLLGIGAFVLDVSRVYSLQRYERSVADAAALAGAQDLQQPGTRNVTAAEYLSARVDAMKLLVSELGGTSTPTGSGANYNCDPGTAPGVNIIDCPIPGTPYVVSIQTNPSPSGVTVDRYRAVQVTVQQQNVPMTLARLFGQQGWNVGIISIAGAVNAPQYAVVTLQPPNPKPNQTDANLNKDLVVSGNNTVLNVLQGDIGTNTSATTTLAGLIELAPGYKIYHYDSFTSPTWTQDANGDPQGQPIYQLIKDPNYMYPSFAGAPTFTSVGTSTTDPTDGAVACPSSSAAPFSDPGWSSLLASAVCYQPGIYNLGTHPFTVGSTETVYLLPGAYYFQSGLTVNGSLFGGLVSNQPGVVLELPQTQKLSANNATNFVLNMGNSPSNASPCLASDNTCKAAPALDFQHKPVQVDASPNPYPLTIEVDRNDACYGGAGLYVPQNVASCETGSTDNTVNLAGKGMLQVAGILYGPSDQMSINGNSSQTGLVGQIYSWTVTYTGGSTLDQAYPGNADNPIMRLDTACSGSIGFGFGPNISCTP